jgi:alpha-glucoside transport system substrate-binding protein
MVVLAVLAAACTTQANRTTEPGSAVIEVFSVYRGTDAESFRRVLDDFEARTGIETAYVGTAAFAARIQERVESGEPPDLALFPQPGLIRDLASRGQLVSLESLGTAAASTARSQYPAFLDSLTVDGELYAVPWRVDLGSLIWYRPDVFAGLGYSVPTSFIELQALVSQMTLDGMTPWCLGVEAFAATGWVGTDWIEDIMLRTQSVAVYDEWARGEVPFDDERVRNAMSTWRDLVLAPGRTFGSVRVILNTPWEQAGAPLFDDEPGCLMHRQLSTYQNHLPAGTTVGPDGDVDVFVMPAANEADQPPLLLAGEFAAALTSKPGVRELLLHLADPRSAESWAEEGGYLSPHRQFDAATYANDFDRTLARLMDDASVLRFDASDTMPPAVGVGTFWDGIVEYVATQDLDRVVATIDAGYGRDPPSSE